MAELQVGKIATMQSGGSARAWLVLLGLFQVTLLIGYIYSYWLLRSGRWALHACFLAISGLLTVWSVASSRHLGFDPAAIETPVRWVVLHYASGPLWLILCCSTTVTLVQGTVSAQRRGLLYAWSNLGAFAGLIAYPLLVEPVLGLQLSAWLLLLCLLVVLVGHGTVSYRLRCGAMAQAIRPPVGSSHYRGYGWLALWAALGSGFLTVATAWATLDLSSIPLLWAILLAAYLLSWVLVMGPMRNAAGHSWDILAAASMLVVLWVPGSGWLNVLAMAACVTLLCAALHQRIASRYQNLDHGLSNIVIALGGAVGGLSCAIIPPLIFPAAWEWELILVSIALALAVDGAARLFAASTLPQRLRSLSSTALLFLSLTLGAGYSWWLAPGPWTILLQTRDYHGLWTVSVAADRNQDFRLVSGSTYHGSWGEEASWSYYGPEGPMGAVFAALRHQRLGGLRVLMVGLGAGTSLEYLFAEDSGLVVDISPALLALHDGPQPLIPALRDCPADLRVRLADGRQVLEESADRAFHLIKLDAFTSGAIPAHLLTREAIARAYGQLDEQGLLMVHTSNQHVAVTEVVMNACRVLGLKAAVLADHAHQEPTDQRAIESTWVVIGSPQVLTHPRILALARVQLGLGHLAAWAEVPAHSDRRQPWTDNTSSIIPYLHWW